MMSPDPHRTNPETGGAARRPLLLSEILKPDANNFGLIRLGLAFAVLVSHAFYLKTGTPKAEPLTAWTGHSLGEHAVQVFFFLSGLLVAQSLAHSRGLVDFATARVLRIFPGLIVCVLLTALVLGPVFTTLGAATYLADPGTYAYIARTVSLSTGLAPLPGVFETLPAASVVNMSVWTLKYEVLCYALLAMAGVAGLLNPRWRLTASVLLAVYLAVIFIEPPKSVDGYTAADNVRYFSLFFGMGILAYMLRDVLVLDLRILALLAVVFYIALGTSVGELGTALFLGYGALMLAALPARMTRAYANRYDLSYGVYIYACPVQQAVVQLVPHWSLADQIFAATVIVMPLALASWVMVERPALALRRKSAVPAGRFAVRLAGIRQARGTH
jgi:peptidoglycan/LPS O-acetylase OafA/YrhL